jgi:hypothetical protein
MHQSRYEMQDRIEFVYVRRIFHKVWQGNLYGFSFPPKTQFKYTMYNVVGCFKKEEYTLKQHLYFQTRKVRKGIYPNNF